MLGCHSSKSTAIDKHIKTPHNTGNHTCYFLFGSYHEHSTRNKFYGKLVCISDRYIADLVGRIWGDFMVDNISVVLLFCVGNMTWV